MKQHIQDVYNEIALINDIDHPVDTWIEQYFPSAGQIKRIRELFKQLLSILETENHRRILLDLESHINQLKRNRQEIYFNLGHHWSALHSGENTTTAPMSSFQKGQYKRLVSKTCFLLSLTDLPDNVKHAAIIEVIRKSGLR